MIEWMTVPEMVSACHAMMLRCRPSIGTVVVRGHRYNWKRLNTGAYELTAQGRTPLYTRKDRNGLALFYKVGQQERRAYGLFTSLRENECGELEQV